MDDIILSIILLIIFMIPLYGVLIWTYFCPEESILFGKRWMYEEEPEVSEAAIRYTKFASMVVMIGLPIILISFISEIYLLRFSLLIVPLVVLIGAIKIFGNEKGF